MSDLSPLSDHHDHLHLHLAVTLLTILTYYFLNFLVHLLCSNIHLSEKEGGFD